MCATGIPGLHADLGLVTVAPKSSAAGLLICTGWFRLRAAACVSSHRALFVLSNLTPKSVVLAVRFSREMEVG